MNTLSFITQIPLHTSSWEQAILGKRFWAAKQQYNALLGEALRRLNAMRDDQHWKRVKEHYAAQEKQKGGALFKALAKAYGYREYDLHSYTKQWNKRKNPLSIGAQISQKLATRAFRAVEEYRKGARGRPRFKGYRGIKSIESGSINTHLRLKDDQLHYAGLRLPLLYDLKDPIHYHGLNSPIKYLRLVQKTFNGRTRYFVQIVCQGRPWRKYERKKGTVGLDIGPSTIAIVSADKRYARLQPFADSLKPAQALKKRLQRRQSRQLRAANPACFQEHSWQKKDKQWKVKRGKSIKGKRLMNRPKRLRKTSMRLADCARREAAHRKSLHGQLAGKVLRLGNHIKTEKLSYKSFQKNWGKSTGLRAPGKFVETLKRKAANADGRVEEINTYKTALSQTCHCGRKKKKELKERWHNCPCGASAQRDLYSAYLACFVEENKLMADHAQKAWSGMDFALRTAMRELKGASSGLVSERE